MFCLIKGMTQPTPLMAIYWPASSRQEAPCRFHLLFSLSTLPLVVDKVRQREQRPGLRDRPAVLPFHRLSSSFAAVGTGDPLPLPNPPCHCHQHPRVLLLCEIRPKSSVRRPHCLRPSPHSAHPCISAFEPCPSAPRYSWPWWGSPGPLHSQPPQRLWDQDFRDAPNVCVSPQFTG